MQVFRQADQDTAELVGLGVRVMILTEESDQHSMAQRISGLGGIAEPETEMYAALAAMIDDPAGYGLFVMDCDPFGGIDAGLRAFSMLSAVTERIPVMLITGDCRQQTFPADRRAPIILRNPLSAVSLRVGFEYALRDRLVWRH